MVINVLTLSFPPGFYTPRGCAGFWAEGPKTRNFFRATCGKNRNFEATPPQLFPSTCGKNRNFTRDLMVSCGTFCTPAVKFERRVRADTAVTEPGDKNRAKSMSFNSKMMSSSHDSALISHAQPDSKGTGSESEHGDAFDEHVKDIVPVSHVYTVLQNFCTRSFLKICVEPC